MDVSEKHSSGPSVAEPSGALPRLFFLNVIQQDTPEMPGRYKILNTGNGGPSRISFPGMEVGLVRLSFRWRRKSQTPTAFITRGFSAPPPSELPLDSDYLPLKIPSFSLSSSIKMLLLPLTIGHILMLFNNHTS